MEALRDHGELHADPDGVPRRVRDPNDDYLVALAKAVGAAIVTGDADLLQADLAPAAITPRTLAERVR